MYYQLDVVKTIAGKPIKVAIKKIEFSDELNGIELGVLMGRYEEQAKAEVGMDGLRCRWWPLSHG